MAFRPAIMASRNHDIGSKTRVMFKASPTAPSNANPKQAYWQMPPKKSQLRISVCTSSRFLKGLFSLMMGMGTTSFFALQQRDFNVYL